MTSPTPPRKFRKVDLATENCALRARVSQLTTDLAILQAKYEKLLQGVLDGRPQPKDHRSKGY